MMTRRSNLRHKMYDSFLFEVIALALICFSQVLYSQNPHLSVFCFLSAIGVSFLSFPVRFHIFQQGFSEINKILVKQLKGEMQRSAYIDFSGFILFAVICFAFPQSMPAFIFPLLILSAAYKYRLYLLECKLKDLSFEEYTSFSSEKPFTEDLSEEDRSRIAFWYNRMRENLKRNDACQLEKVNASEIIKSINFN